ncbi:MAG: twin-arginine translocation signal domain-containing protein [Faecalibacterium prausnitzii]|nr:twin-arginine translocation signal domain-containing protein [Faecalibacterium prausnitzii]
MEQTFSRRGFLKGAAAAALAVSAMGLTGCAGEDSPTTAVILGDYKVDLDLKRSVLGKNGDGSATVKLSVFVTNNDAGAAAMPFIRSMFPSLYAGETELKAGNSKTEFATLPMRVPTECTPSFIIEDADLYQQVNSGAVDLKLTVKLSGQTAVYTLNFGTLTKTVEKIG